MDTYYVYTYIYAFGSMVQMSMAPKTETLRNIANGAAPRRWAHVPGKMFYYFEAFCFLFIAQNAAGQNTNHVFSHDFKQQTAKTENEKQNTKNKKKTFDACILLANIYLFAFIVYCCFLKFFLYLFSALLFRLCVIYLASARAEEFVELHAWLIAENISRH